MLTKAPFMTTPWIGWSVIDSLVEACELLKVLLDNTTPRTKDKIRRLLIIIKTIEVRSQNHLISITDIFIKRCIRAL